MESGSGDTANVWLLRFSGVARNRDSLACVPGVAVICGPFQLVGMVDGRDRRARPLHAASCLAVPTASHDASHTSALLLFSTPSACESHISVCPDSLTE